MDDSIKQNTSSITPEEQKIERIKASDAYLCSNDSQGISEESLTTSRINFDGKTEYGQANSNIDDVKRKIASCREMYENVGIIGNVIDLMVDFAIEGFTIAHKNGPIDNFFNNWVKEVKLTDVCTHVLKSLYRDSNVPILSEYRELTTEQEVDFKKLIAAEDEENKSESSIIKKKNRSESVSGKKIVDNQIPGKYNVIDVMNLYQEGSEILGNFKYFYQLPADDVRGLSDTSAEAKRAKKRLQDSLTPRDFALFEKSGRLPLNPDRFDMLFYKKDMHKHWATPMLHRVTDDVKFKKLLRDMDISVAEGVCNTLTFVTIGDVAAGYAAPATKYAKMANLLKNRTKSKIVVWDNLIKVIAEYPPIDKILGKAKYEQVDGDIRSGLGIPEVLVNGQGGNYSNSFLSVKTLLERLEYGRNMLIEWIEEQIMIITKAMGFRRPPTIKFDHMSLTDENAEKQMVLELVDRNIVSTRTALEYFGENIDIEEMRMKQEDETREELKDSHPFTLLKTGKFGPIHANGIIPIGQKAPDPKDAIAPSTPSAQGPSGELGGRPPNTKKKQTTKRNTEPKGQKNKTPKQKAKADDEYIDSFIIGTQEILEIASRFSIIYDSIVGFGKIEESDIDNAVIAIMCRSEFSELLTDEVITKYLSMSEEELAIAPLKLERCVKEVTVKKTADFKEKNGRSPNNEEKKAIISSCYAICKSSLDM